MSIHDLIEPLNPSDIRCGRQIRLRPGQCAVVFTPKEHGMVAQSIIAHPLGGGARGDAQALAVLLTWGIADTVVRQRLDARLAEVRRVVSGGNGA